MTFIAVSKTDEEIYEHPLIYSQETETFLCPVCKKSYNLQTRALTHLAKRNCATALHRFKDTITERAMFDAYASAAYLRGVTYPITLPSFRASRSYTAFAKLMIFCAKNKIEIPLQYSDFCIMQKPSDPITKLLAIGCTDRMLKKYRAFLLHNPDLISSEAFFAANSKRLQEDLSFVVRSVERANISLEYLVEHMDTALLLEKASAAELARFKNLCGASRKHPSLR